MAGACPKCGWQPVVGASCPRCGVDVASYRSALLRPSGPEAPGAAVTTAIEISSAPALPSDARTRYRPAGFWIRVAALLIDWGVLLTAQLVLFGLAWAVFGGASSAAIHVAVQAFAVVLVTVYPVLFHWRWGQTVGKMAVEIRVVSCAPTPTTPGWLVDGGSLTLGCAILRQLGMVISSMTLCIGYLMVAVRADRRALHDLIAGTRVERRS